MHDVDVFSVEGCTKDEASNSAKSVDSYVDHFKSERSAVKKWFLGSGY